MSNTQYQPIDHFQNGDVSTVYFPIKDEEKEVEEKEEEQEDEEEEGNEDIQTDKQSTYEGRRKHNLAEIINSSCLLSSSSFSVC